MLDTTMRRFIDRPLNSAGRFIARSGVGANTVTFAGLAIGLLAALAVGTSYYALAFVLIIVNRITDGLDGAVARATKPTDAGGYLDIVVDFVFYASVPLAFAVSDPVNNAVPAAALLAGFCLTCATFLTFATIAAKRGLETEAHGKKSFFYSTGLVEGTETVLFFLAMTAMPQWFPILAWIFAALCVLTAIQRTAYAMKVF